MTRDRRIERNATVGGSVEGLSNSGTFCVLASLACWPLSVRTQGGVGIKKRDLGSNFFFQRREVDLPTT